MVCRNPSIKRGFYYGKNLFQYYGKYFHKEFFKKEEIRNEFTGLY